MLPDRGRLLLEPWNRGPGDEPEWMAAMKNSNRQADRLLAKIVVHPAHDQAHDLAWESPPSLCRPDPQGKQLRSVRPTARFGRQHRSNFAHRMLPAEPPRTLRRWTSSHHY